MGSHPGPEMPDFWASLLASMHSFWHISMTLQPIDPHFNITLEYLQSLCA